MPVNIIETYSEFLFHRHSLKEADRFIDKVGKYHKLGRIHVLVSRDLWECLGLYSSMVETEGPSGIEYFKTSVRQSTEYQMVVICDEDPNRRVVVQFEKFGLNKYLEDKGEREKARL